MDMIEIGAGGGSIAHLNELGLPSVGPESAGAEPGPACYGLGGEHPTITDADLLLGYLDPDHFLGGDMTLDPALSHKAMMTQIGERLGMSVYQVAWGIHDLVNEKMAAATRAHAAESGIDLRRFSLIAFGGAGPVHAYAIARKLGMPQVLCPLGAGVASAIGCLVAPPAIDLVTAHEGELDHLDWPLISQEYSQMRQQGEVALGTLTGGNIVLNLQAAFEMRCQGQGYSITVPIGDNPTFGHSTGPLLTKRFDSQYRRIYGHLPPAVPLEVVALRARIGQPRDAVEFRANSSPNLSPSGPEKNRRVLRFTGDGETIEGVVYDRYALNAGYSGDGPAVIEERETSIVIGPDARFRIDPEFNLIIELEQ